MTLIWRGSTARRNTVLMSRREGGPALVTLAI
jgi:hypothetical protein